jgi:hypothetical protein
VIDVNNGPIFENSYVAHGMLRGSVPVTNIGTIKVTIRPGSVSFSEGQGVITNVNGDVQLGLPMVWDICHKAK